MLNSLHPNTSYPPSKNIRFILGPEQHRLIAQHFAARRATAPPTMPAERPEIDPKPLMLAAGKIRTA